MTNGQFMDFYNAIFIGYGYADRVEACVRVLIDVTIGANKQCRTE
ncbi:hypothetical protein BIW11_12006, partial [Tropilaelaps mercedesae]